MASTNRQKSLLASILMLITIGILAGISLYMKFVPTTGFYPDSSVRGVAEFDTLEDFVATVKNGNSSQIVGVYVPGVIALPVSQQPQNNAGFVTRNSDEVTQFSTARQYGTIGLLAHNDLAGAEFYNIELDQYAIVVYGDGSIEYFVIHDIQKYQALSPTSTYSDFINLANPQEQLSAGSLFSRIYGSGNRLVFQTCIEGNGDASWGRMFIIAEPATKQVLSVVQQTSFLLQFTSFGMAAAR